MSFKFCNSFSISFVNIKDKNLNNNILTMKELIVEQSSNSPKVVLDPKNDHFEISGESRPENVSKFYQPLLQWLDDLGAELEETENKSKSFLFNFNFEYFNSSSAKFILDFFKKLGKLISEGNNFRVKWHYEEDDEDMLEVGKEMSRMAKFPFEFVEIKI